mmetsp:Transcript_109162/g.250438  ORF Transcript_109162/g.250438 Transcript_109162/m.250438 type:complete len:307 (-) Transcript_109162:297-1217(-)
MNMLSGSAGHQPRRGYGPSRSQGLRDQHRSHVLLHLPWHHWAPATAPTILRRRHLHWSRLSGDDLPLWAAPSRDSPAERCRRRHRDCPPRGNQEPAVLPSRPGWHRCQRRLRRRAQDVLRQRLLRRAVGCDLRVWPWRRDGLLPWVQCPQIHHCRTATAIPSQKCKKRTAISLREKVHSKCLPHDPREVLLHYQPGSVRALQHYHGLLKGPEALHELLLHASSNSVPARQGIPCAGLGRLRGLPLTLRRPHLGRGRSARLAEPLQQLHLGVRPADSLPLRCSCRWRGGLSGHLGLHRCQLSLQVVK